MSFNKKNSKKQAQYIGLSQDGKTHVFETVQVYGLGSKVLTIEANASSKDYLKEKEGSLFPLTAGGKIKL